MKGFHTRITLRPSSQDNIGTIKALILDKGYDRDTALKQIDLYRLL